MESIHEVVSICKYVLANNYIDEFVKSQLIEFLNAGEIIRDRFLLDEADSLVAKLDIPNAILTYYQVLQNEKIIENSNLKNAVYIQCRLNLCISLMRENRFLETEKILSSIYDIYDGKHIPVNLDDKIDQIKIVLSKKSKADLIDPMDYPLLLNSPQFHSKTIHTLSPFGGFRQNGKPKRHNRNRGGSVMISNFNRLLETKENQGSNSIEIFQDSITQTKLEPFLSPSRSDISTRNCVDNTQVMINNTEVLPVKSERVTHSPTMAIMSSSKELKCSKTNKVADINSSEFYDNNSKPQLPFLISSNFASDRDSFSNKDYQLSSLSKESINLKIDTAVTLNNNFNNNDIKDDSKPQVPHFLSNEMVLNPSLCKVLSNNSIGTNNKLRNYYSYDILKNKESCPKDVDLVHRELHLSPDDFYQVFHVKIDEWDNIPLWKQINLRKKYGLF